MMLSQNPTSGNRETLVIDINQEDAKAVEGITMKFYETGEENEYIFMNGPF